MCQSVLWPECDSNFMFNTLALPQYIVTYHCFCQSLLYVRHIVIGTPAICSLPFAFSQHACDYSVCALALYWALCAATASEKRASCQNTGLFAKALRSQLDQCKSRLRCRICLRLYTVAQLVSVAQLQLTCIHGQCSLSDRTVMHQCRHHHMLFKMLLSMWPGCFYQVQEQRSSVSVPFWWRLQLLCIPGKKPRQAIY